MRHNSIKPTIRNRIMAVPNLREVVWYVVYCGMCAVAAWVGSGHHPH